MIVKRTDTDFKRVGCSDDEILMTATLIYPSDPFASGTYVEFLKAEMNRKCPKNGNICAAVWRNGISVVLPFPKKQSLPTPQSLLNAYRDTQAQIIQQVDALNANCRSVTNEQARSS